MLGRMQAACYDCLLASLIAFILDDESHIDVSDACEVFLRNAATGGIAVIKFGQY